MIKKTFFIILIALIVGCAKNDVFERENQIIINPIAKCENGFAGEYPCNDYDLLTHISLEELGDENTIASNCWGWSDPVNKNEFALICTNKGVTFINITDPANAVVLGTLKTKNEDNVLRNIVTFQSFAYVISESSNHGIQSLNLGRLLGINNPPVEFTSDKDYNFFRGASNISVDENSGFAYVSGTNTFNGGIHFLNLNKPSKVLESDGFADDSYSNETKVITYKGPDTDYTDKEILIGSNNSEVVILDVTDKENPVKITSFTYPNIGKAHQGWFTEDFKYFIFGDTLDEINNGVNTNTIVYDFTDLDNPVHHFNYEGNTAAIDNKSYVKNNLYYQANFTNGIRIIDISNIDSKSFTEIGFFDTYPENNNTEAKGTVNVYPYLESGNIIVSDTNNGFFLIRKSKT
ncbi:choice-of-anchor B family protein [Polaribacter sp. Z022]|uniref:choice-of-anchor B family protein n=1 Tax=Polaribacter sp. Z022 TaxID=2927125 RepID=UPI0020223D94|nr:choice-of-anchor B family protein [Polaribacter sp. Z022]MCL7752403.1 choice-of-anchor B family protein [Polaribacter sp. Z022]